MNRRGFLRTMLGGVAATAAVRTWPFRVYSIPNKIRSATLSEILNLYPEPNFGYCSREMYIWLKTGMRLVSQNPRGQCRIYNVSLE